MGGKNGNVKGLVKRIYRDVQRREIHDCWEQLIALNVVELLLDFREMDLNLD